MERLLKFSRQEERVLALARQGLGDKQIANDLGLSPDTVRTYWQRIRQKIGAGTRAEIIATVSDNQIAAVMKLAESEKDILLQEILRRKTVEKALRASEQQWRNLADSMPHMVFVSNPGGEVYYFNKQVYKYSGLPEPTLGGRGWSDIAHPEDQTKLNRGFQILQRRGTFPVMLSRFRRSDGEYRWHYSQAVAVKGENDRVICWYGTATDVHEEILLRDRLSQAQRLAKLGTFEYEVATRQARWSEDLFEMFEVPRQDGWFNADLFLELAHPDDIETIRQAIVRTIKEKADFEAIYRMNLQSGRTIWVRSFAKPVILDQEVVRLEGTTQDITETQKFAQEIARRERALATAEKIAKIGSFEWDVVDQKILWSPNMAVLFEAETPEQLTGEEFYRLLHPDDHVLYRSTIVRTLKEGIPFDLRYRLVFKDQTRWIHALGVPTIENGKTVRVIGTCQDVTDEVAARSEYERQRIQFQLAQQVAKLGSFSTDYVSRELIWSDYMYELFEREVEKGAMWSGEIELRIHPDDLPTYQCELHQLKTQGKQVDIEFRYLLKSGQYRWMHTRMIGSMYNNVLVAVHGIVQDVTDAPFGFIGG